MPETTRPRPGRKEPVLSDRGALKLAMWAIALTLAWAGVAHIVDGSAMRYEVEPAETSDPACMVPAEGGAPTADGNSTGEVCAVQQVSPAKTAVTAQGRGLQALGVLLLAMAAGLLLYQAARWNPSRVGAWFAKAETSPAARGVDGPATDRPDEADRP